MQLAIEHRDVPSARARLVLVHGYAEHRGRYRALVDELTANGIACHLFDLRGHGESDGPRGHVDRFEDYLDDLQRVIDTLPASNAPLFLLAHSLGALIALCYIRKHPHPFRGIAVSSPFLGPAFAVPAARQMLARAASVTTPALKFESGLLPEWVSRDPEIVAAYAADPHVFSTTTPRWFIEVSAAQRDLLEHASEITTPALFLVAGSDRIADHQIAKEFFSRIGTPDSQKELHVYPDLYHEVFNELAEARAEVISDLVAWIRRSAG